MNRLKQLISRYEDKWYFFPLVGGILFIVVNLGLFGVLAFTSRDSNSNNSASPTPQPSLEPTPTPFENPVTSVAPTPETNTTPSPKSSPKTSPKPSPSQSPKSSPTPTPVVYEKQDVQIINPENQKNYEGTSIEIEMKALINSEIEKLEVILNGSVKESFDSTTIKKTYDLAAGKYTLKGRAKLKNGETVESGELKFGTGGVAWNQPDPSPSPSPTASPLDIILP